MKVGTRVGLLLVVATALLVRLAALPHGTGASWDSAGYVDAAEHLGAVLGGTFPSVYGAKLPHIYPLGLPLLLRVVGAFFAFTVTAGVVVSVLAGVGTVVASFALARELHGEATGLIAALWLALDPIAVEYDSVVTSEALYAFLVTLACVLALRARARPGWRAHAAIASFAASAFVRAAGLPIFALGAAFAVHGAPPARRRALVAAAVLLAAFELGLSSYVSRVNGCAPYWRSNADGTLFDEGEYPDAFDVGSDGATLRYIVDRPPAATLLEHRATFARVGLHALARPLAARWAAWALALVALACALRRREARAEHAFLLALCATGILFPVATLIHRNYMLRMLMPHLATLHALAALGLARLGAAALGAAKLATPAGWRATALALLLGAAGAWLAFENGLEDPRSALLLGDARTYWVRSRGFAERVQAAVPASERILRGPGGVQDLNALFSRHYLAFPDAPPGRLAGYIAKNDVHYLLHGTDAAVLRLLAERLPGRRLVEVARLEGDLRHPGQAVSRIE